MRTKWISRALAACVVVACLGGAQGAPADSSGARCGARGYTFQTIDPPFGTPGVDMNVQILLMNNSGVVTAQYQAPPDPTGNFYVNMHSALRQHGKWTSLDIPGAVNTAVTNANNRGQVVLSYQLLENGPWLASIYDRRDLKRFPDIPGYAGGMIGNGINDLGRIAAVVIDEFGGFHGYVGGRENYEIVDYPGALWTVPMNLNNRPTTVGYCGLADGSTRGFWYQGGQFGSIDVPDADDTWPTAINNSGVVVGFFQTSEPAWLGFVLERGRYTSIQVPGALATNLWFVNDRGQLSGLYYDQSGMIHGFVATPTCDKH